MTLLAGQPWPLGAHCVGEGQACGVNFAVWAPDAKGVDVCLFDPAGTVEVQRFALPTCSEGVWHGLLVGASAAGLEVLSKKGDWVPFTSDADTIVVNIGDMLQRLTNHVYPSTTHRVTNPPGEAARNPRYSVPFFLHPNPDFLIDVLPSTITPDNPSRYPEPITAQGYLEERLREIKLK